MVTLAAMMVVAAAAVVAQDDEQTASSSYAAELKSTEEVTRLAMAHQHFLRSLYAKQAAATIQRFVVYALYEDFGTLIEPLFESMFNPPVGDEDDDPERPRAQLLPDGRDIVCVDDIETGAEGDAIVVRHPNGPACRLDDIALVFRVRFADRSRRVARIGVPFMSVIDTSDPLPPRHTNKDRRSDGGGVFEL